MAKIYLSTGSNQGERLDSLLKAAKLIDTLIGKIICFSDVFESEPWGFNAEMNFYNQVLFLETDFNPQQTIKMLLKIEKLIGRKREGTSYSSRTIDIDILFFDEIQIAGKNLVVPHPRLHERRFVLQPLSKIAPDLVHPVLRKTVSELLNLLNAETELPTVFDKNEFEKCLSKLI